mmetsp:Transcript_4954/g.12853  ORF Transcript_4954/g.12853 Transcript_4954/m.12853 type:complete len:219 (-) Transcript_4954:1313-1969(-)
MACLKHHFSFVDKLISISIRLDILENFHRNLLFRHVLVGVHVGHVDLSELTGAKNLLWHQVSSMNLPLKEAFGGRCARPARDKILRHVALFHRRTSCRCPPFCSLGQTSRPHPPASRKPCTLKHLLHKASSWDTCCTQQHHVDNPCALVAMHHYHLMLVSREVRNGIGRPRVEDLVRQRTDTPQALFGYQQKHRLSMFRPLLDGSKALNRLVIRLAHL